MVELELTYDQLYKLYGNGEHEVPYPVTDELYVRTPTGHTKINEVVTKCDNEVIRLDFTDGDKFECSTNHVFCDYNTDMEVKAIDANEIVSLYGKKTVKEKTPIGIENVYDISIDFPHWYIANEKSGIIHHNTYFSLAVVKNFLNANPTGFCLYFDTESAITKNILISRGIDVDRVAVINVVTIEEFRSKALKAVDMYMKKPEEERSPCMFVLDSLGMLSTTKEISDALAGEEKRDMTKASLIKGAFRMLTLKLGQANIPMIVTNHLYSNVGGYGPTQVQSGGSGLQYSSSTIIYLSKSKEKSGTEIVGNIIKAKAIKSRLSRENREVEIRLFYDERGLDRYYGLIELGEESGIIPRIGNRYEINGKKLGKNQILAEPELHFTDEILCKLDEYARKKFVYGSTIADENEVMDGEN